MNDPLRVAILGSGFIARTHAYALTHGCTGVVLAGIAGGTRAAGLAAEFGVPLFNSPEELVSHTTVDAVIITTPHHLHRDHALLCAGNRKHVLLEKPMATSVQACEEIINAFRAAEVQLMVAFTQRFRRSNLTAYKLIHEKKIGRVLAIQEYALLPNGLNAYPTWQQNPENLGILFGYGIHNIDKLRWFLRDEVDTVAAQTQRSPTGIETTTMCTLRWRSEVLTNLWSSVDLPTPGFPATAFRSRIVGETGLLDVDGYGTVQFAARDGSWETVFVQPPIDWRGSGLFSPARMGSFNAQDQAFVDAVRYDATPPVTGTDGLRAVAIALAIYDSAARNQVIHLPVT